jgi:putative transposase
MFSQQRMLHRIPAGQAVGIKEVHDDIWLVSFMDFDLGYFDLETRVLEPLENPFGPRLLTIVIGTLSGLDPG